MTRLLLIVEGNAEADFLRAFLPQVGISPRQFQVVPHDGKPGVIANFHRLVNRWDEPETRFIVLLDQDSRDCRELKRIILDSAREKCPAKAGRLMVRVACRELEAWYLGDAAALREAYPDAKDSAWEKIEKRRDPDNARKAKPSELLRRLPNFVKRDAARRVGEIMGRKWAESANGNRSTSFRCFVAGVMKMLGE